MTASQTRGFILPGNPQTSKAGLFTRRTLPHSEHAALEFDDKPGPRFC